MNIGFDIGGVLTKYPREFYSLAWSLKDTGNELYVITDQHNLEEIIKALELNAFSIFKPQNIFSANYEKYGNMAKAILIKELKIDIFFDDFDGYLQWDSTLGSQPILLKIMPDAYKPYWANSWQTYGDIGDFGRRVYHGNVN